MKLSEFLESLPNMLIEWREIEFPVDADAARALNLTRQGFAAKEAKLPNAQFSSILKFVHMLEKQSNDSPEIIIMPVKGLTKETSNDVD